MTCASLARPPSKNSRLNYLVCGIVYLAKPIVRASDRRQAPDTERFRGSIVGPGRNQPETASFPPTGVKGTTTRLPPSLVNSTDCPSCEAKQNRRAPASSPLCAIGSFAYFARNPKTNLAFPDTAPTLLHHMNPNPPTAVSRVARSLRDEEHLDASGEIPV